MTALLLLLTLLCVFGVLHTYVYYPTWVVKKAADHLGQSSTEGKQENQAAVKQEPAAASALPQVFVLMAAHNEEAVLAEKLATLARQDYSGKLHFLIGSDNSSDRTNEILEEWAARDPRFRPTLFTSRQGKPGIINQLAEMAGPSGIYILTDASVMLRPSTISALVTPMLENEQIGIVDTTMLQMGGTRDGIGEAETAYIAGEVNVKRAEGILWGAMIGPFGGCYALRAAAYRPVPDNFLVDDFYLCMCAYEQGFRGISSATAIVEESVGQAIKDEFKRKLRISSGNWQNLFRFKNLWFPPWKDELAFALFSHKILRWLTPFFLIIGALSWFALALRTDNYWAFLSFSTVSSFVIGAFLLDLLLSSMGIHDRHLRRIRYFLAMNAALLLGFFRFLTGIQSNVWQPSNRN